MTAKPPKPAPPQMSLFGAPAPIRVPPAAMPKMQCPRCARESDDFDGIGVQFCAPPDGCGYCLHASRSDGRCDACADRAAPATPPPAEAPPRAREFGKPWSESAPAAAPTILDGAPIGAGVAIPAAAAGESAAPPAVVLDDDSQAMLPGLQRTPAEGAEALSRQAADGRLAGKFLIPPFSTLDTRAGYWQERKRAWLALGIQSEIGRGENLLGMSDTVLEPDPEKRAAKKSGRPLTFTGARDVAAEDLDDTTKRILSVANTGTSIFDPLLAECLYLWFSPRGGRVLDPFAGGSVRGIVAAKLGRDYTGIDLSAAQIAANEAQRAALLSPEEQARVRWICGDSRDCRSIAPGEYDFVMTCPPYSFLERYSDDQRDLSTMEYDEFVRVYSEIIAKACAMLRPNRFAAIVVSEVRARKPPGQCLGFEPDTIAAIRAAGLLYYNRFVLINSVGSLSVRVTAQSNKSRKNGGAHQFVVVGVKGDPFAAAKEFGPIESEVPQKPRDAHVEAKVLICGHRAHECRDPGKAGPCAHAECCPAEAAAPDPIPPPAADGAPPPQGFVGLAPRDDDDPEEL